MGLYDAVDMVPGYGVSEQVPNNVRFAVHSMGDPDLGSRWYFNTADGAAENASLTDLSEHYIWGTHAALGGAPWYGDHPGGIEQWQDKLAAIAADWQVRYKAIAVGVPVMMPNYSLYKY